MIDGLAASVAALSLEAPRTPSRRPQGASPSASPDYGSALQLATTTGPASEDRAQVAATLRDRLEDFSGSLTALRDAARGQPPTTS